jgi:hypothetical protein
MVFLRFSEGSFLNRWCNFGGRISSSFILPGSGEGSAVENRDVETVGSGSAVERLSWIDTYSSWRDSLWSVGKKESS